MNFKESINDALKTKSVKNDSQLNVLISKHALLAFKEYAKSNGTTASKLTRAFVKAILEGRDEV